MKEGKEKPPEPCSLICAKIPIGLEIPIFIVDDFHLDKDLDDLKPKIWKHYIGIFFAILASVFLSLSSLVVKYLPNYHALNISTWRFQGVLIPNILILLYYFATKNPSIGKNVWPIGQVGAKRNLFILFLRGLVGGISAVTQVYSLQYLNIADSTVICLSSPVFVAFLAHFILGEVLGIVPVVASIVTLGGVIVITRPPILSGSDLSMDTLIGIGMALSSMIGTAGVLVILRFLRDVNANLTTTAFGFVGILLSLTLSFGSGVFQLPEGRDDWVFASALGALNFFGQVFFTLALQYEEASLVALIRSGDVIFAFIWQYIFLGVWPDMFSILGSVIVISAVLVVGLRKWVDGLPSTHTTRQRFWFLLV